MWDNTEHPFTHQPSTALNQRITHSTCHRKNCAKGGIFLQLCRWFGIAHLWIGAISNSKYVEVNKIFLEQNSFTKKDLVDGKELVFTNIFDKGYRLLLLTWQSGKQLIQQPVFAKSDEKFTAEETMSSASTATDRSGNERAVNIQKRVGYIQKGICSKSNLKRADNVWIAWSFQENFMFKPVL